MCTMQANEYSERLKRTVKQHDNAAQALEEAIPSDPFDRLAFLAGMAAAADSRMWETVNIARDQHGFTWSEIGTAIGTSSNGARQAWLRRQDD